MGVWKQHTTFRFSEETLMQIDQIKAAFSPFAEDRSSTLRIIVHVLYSILFTPTTLQEVLMVCQRLQKATLCNADQMQFRFPAHIDMRPRIGGFHVQP